MGGRVSGKDRVPWGKAACATRAVSSGTDWMEWGLSDITDLLVFVGYLEQNNLL
jgi:hypothetical protein